MVQLQEAYVSDERGKCVASAWNAPVFLRIVACQVFGRHMIERGYGRIINIASLSSFVALYEVAAYSASKAAVASLTKSLAIEWARSGVCVNAIAPGVFRTDLNSALLDGTDRGREFLLRTPMKRFGKLDELGGAAVFLASEAASFVTGHVLAVDGGFLASGVKSIAHTWRLPPPAVQSSAARLVFRGQHPNQILRSFAPPDSRGRLSPRGSSTT